MSLLNSGGEVLAPWIVQEVCDLVFRIVGQELMLESMDWEMGLNGEGGLGRTCAFLRVITVPFHKLGGIVIPQPTWLMQPLPLLPGGPGGPVFYGES